MSRERQNEWGSKRYQNWRNSVFERDKYECKHCGSKQNLNAHHIESYVRCIEKRYHIDNGLTLCLSCHCRHDSTGRKASLETRLKMSESHNGFRHTEESKIKISKSHIGIRHTPEIIKQISEKLKGKIPWNKGKKDVYSEETRNKMSNSLKGKKAWNKGLSCSDEVKKQMSISRKGRPSPNKGKKMSEEQKKKISDTKRKKYADSSK